MKRVDITEKLSFGENPVLVIKGLELEVKSDAPTVLKVMELMSNDTDIAAIAQACKILFTDEANKNIEKLNINMNDLIIVVQEAIKLIVGEADQKK